MRSSLKGRLLFIPIGVLLVLLLSVFLFRRQIGLAAWKIGVESRQSTDFIQMLPDGLHLGLCGAASPMADSKRMGPCVFIIAGQKLYVVDAGDGSTKILTLVGITVGKVDSIFLTHFHSDHIGGLGEMMLQRWVTASNNLPVTVIGPQGLESVVNGFNQAYTLDKIYRVKHHGPITVPPSGSGGKAQTFTVPENEDYSRVVLEKDGLKVTAFSVDHSPVFPAVGYRFDYKGRSVVISGDTAPSKNLASHSKGADVLVHEGLQTSTLKGIRDSAAKFNKKTIVKIMEDIPSYHTTPEDAAKIAQESGVRHLLLYHIVPPVPFSYLNAAYLGDAPKNFDGPITVGKDGIFFSLPADTSEIQIRDLL